MDESALGNRDKRGFWRPNKKLELWASFSLAIQGLDFFEMAIWLSWFYFSMECWISCYNSYSLVLSNTINRNNETLSIDWMALVFLRNVALTIIIVSAWYFFLYMKKTQSTEFKYNKRWPQDNKSSIFMFKSQTLDSIFWTFASGVPIWTLYETLMLWLYSSGRIPWIDASMHPIWFVVLMFLNTCYS